MAAYVSKPTCHNDAGDEDEEEDEAEGGTGKRAAEDDDDEVSGFVCLIWFPTIRNMRGVFLTLHDPVFRTMSRLRSRRRTIKRTSR